MAISHYLKMPSTTLFTGIPSHFFSCKVGMELLQSKPYQESARAIIVDEARCILEW